MASPETPTCTRIRIVGAESIGTCRRGADGLPVTYRSADLRRDLRRTASPELPFSTTRRFAVLLPLVAAALLWFAIPGLADQPASLSVNAPQTLTPGQSATITATASNDGGAGTAPVDVTVSVPSGFTITAASDGGSIAGSTATWHNSGLAGGSSATETVTVAVPSGASPGTVSAQASLTVSGSEKLTASSQSTVAAGAVQGTTTTSAPPPPGAGPGAGAPTAAGPTRAPVTGAATDLMRFCAVGLALVVSGFGIVGGLRTSPHFASA